MLSLFTYKKNVSFIFFIVLIIDIVIKFIEETSLLRVFTKSGLILTLVFYCFANTKYQKKRHFIYVITALALFWIGDILMLFYKTPYLYDAAVICFIIAKIFYIFRLITNTDFKLSKILPYLSVLFVYMVFVFSLMYNNFKDHWFYLALTYLFVGLNVFLFTLLRKNAVNKASYLWVLYGVIASIISDSIVSLMSFSTLNIPFGTLAMMFFYGISQFFIVTGLVEEGKRKYTKTLFESKF